MVKDGFELSQTRRTLPMALLRARERLMERFRPLLTDHGVTEQQWRVLRVLQEVDSMDASEISNAACILAPSLSRIIKTLEARGFIKSQKDKDDGRRIRIALTDDGDAFIRQIAPKSAAIYSDLEARIGKERVQTLLDELDLLLTALSRSQR